MTVVKKEQTDADPITSQVDTRRAFLKKFGRYAAVTPPAMSILLSTTLESEATYTSGGGRMTKKHKKFRGLRKVRKLFKRHNKNKFRKISKHLKKVHRHRW